MKRSLSIILITATVATILLGGFMMYHDNYSQCPISNLDNNTCTSIANPFAQAISHLNTIIGILAGIVVWPAAVMLLPFLLVLGIFFNFLTANSPRANFAYLRFSNNAGTLVFRGRFLRWLSFLEKRDPLIIAAAKI